MKNFTPDEVRGMSLAEASLAIDGFAQMKRAEAGAQDEGPPTEAEARALFAEIEGKANGYNPRRTERQIHG